MKSSTSLLSVSILATLGLSGCAAGPADLATGTISEGERSRLRALGVEDARRVGETIELFDADDVSVGHVALRADGGYDVELDGTSARIEHEGSEVRWTCDDGYTSATTDDGSGIWGWLATDEDIVDGPCVAALAVGWVASGVFRQPAEGCRRVIVEGDARMVCDDGVASASLLSECDGGGGGGGGWGDGCIDDGTGCSPACQSCGGFAAQAGLTTAAICHGGGGGGGGGGDWCSGTRRTFNGSNTSSSPVSCPSVDCGPAESAARDRCTSSTGSATCRTAHVRDTSTRTWHNDYRSTGGDCTAVCEATVTCEYTVW